MGLLHRSTGIEQLSKRVQAGHYAGDFFGSVGFDVSGMTQSRKVPCFDVGTQCGALRVAAARSGRESRRLTRKAYFGVMLCPKLVGTA